MDSKILTKYKDAAKIADAAMKYIFSLLKDGADIAILCRENDKFIESESGKVYIKNKCKRGIAMPTSINVNNIISNFSPIEQGQYFIKDGDLIKVQFGVHIDGYPVISAHTFVCGAEEVKDRRADVLIAANVAANCITRTLSTETTPLDIEEIIKKVAQEFKCHPIIDVHAEELGHYRLYAADNDWLNNSPDKPLDPGKAYSINIAMSTREPTSGSTTDDTKDSIKRFSSVPKGEAALRSSFKDTEFRPTIYEIVPVPETGEKHVLKMKSSKYVYSEIKKSTCGFPFNIRNLAKDKSILTTSQNMGIADCFKHDILNRFIIQKELDGHFVSRLRFTIVMSPNGPICLDTPIFETEHLNIASLQIINDKEIKSWLVMSDKTRIRKSKPKI